MTPTITYPFLQSIVQQVKAAFPGASVICAGGAPRDLYHGKPVKDIDIFIEMQTIVGWRAARAEELEEQRKAQEKLGLISSLKPLREVWKDDESIYMEWFNGCEGLSGLWHTPWIADGDQFDIVNSKGYSYGAFTLVDYPCGPRGYPIQLIFLDMDPVENVKNHFDFGLSQIWVNDHQLRALPQFWRDHYSGRITYLPSTEPVLQRRWSSLNRVERLKVKYPERRIQGLGKLTFTPEERMRIEKLYGQPTTHKKVTQGRVCKGKGD